MLAPVTGLVQAAQDGDTTTFAWNTGDPYTDGYHVLVDGQIEGSVTGTGADVTTGAGKHVVGVAPFADPTPPTVVAFTVPQPLQKPLTPVGLTVDTVTPTTAHVSAGTVPLAADYGLQIDGAWLTGQAVPDWQLNGLEPGVAHVVRVDAANAAGASDPSAPVGFDTPPLPTEPATPVGLRVDNVTQTSAVVSCMASAGALTYGLELDGVLLAQQADPTWPLSGLDPDSEHTVIVDASNAVGTSDPSAPFTFTTANPVSPPPPKAGVDPALALAGVGLGLALIAILAREKHAPFRERHPAR